MYFCEKAIWYLELYHDINENIGLSNIFQILQSLKESKKSDLVINFKKIIHQSIIQFLAQKQRVISLNYSFLYIKTKHMLDILALHLYLLYFWLYHNVPYVWLKNCLEITLFLCLLTQKNKANKPIIQVSSLSTTLFIFERTVSM